MLYFDDQVCIPWKTHQQNKKIIKQTNKQKHLKQNEQKKYEPKRPALNLHYRITKREFSVLTSIGIIESLTALAKFSKETGGFNGLLMSSLL